MDPKYFGATVTALRKHQNLTQAALAKALNVSDKAVSKWETGLGFPEITLLPKLASALGVSVDYLLSGQRKGICVAGNMIVDTVKRIQEFPKVGMMTYVTNVEKAVGGCACNTAIDLAKMDSTLPVSVAGCVGDDPHGQFLTAQMQKEHIDTTGIRYTTKVPTSFCDVMSLPSGERTFFHNKGANALFGPEHLDIVSLQCSLLHIGYILLLDKFDGPDEEYGTVMARFLHQVQKAGIKTSIDVVSDNSGDYAGKIIPSLRYCDYVIINETECCSIWGIDPYLSDGSINVSAVRAAMEKTMACGVGEKVIVHCKAAGFCLDKSGSFTVVPSLKIPAEQIKGSVGAGDAFCAGCLYGIYNGFTDEQLLEFASGAAACNLFAENSVDGMRSKQEILELIKNTSKRILKEK